VLQKVALRLAFLRVFLVYTVNVSPPMLCTYILFSFLRCYMILAIYSVVKHNTCLSPFISTVIWSFLNHISWCFVICDAKMYVYCNRSHNLQMFRLALMSLILGMSRSLFLFIPLQVTIMAYSVWVISRGTTFQPNIASGTVCHDSYFTKSFPMNVRIVLYIGHYYFLPHSS
jgi:hypothetical protein